MDMPFEGLGLHSHLVKAIRNLGYTQPTPIQAEAIPAASSGKDLIGGTQRGTGKTAAFLLPVLQRMTLSLQKAGSPRRSLGGNGRNRRKETKETRMLQEFLIFSAALYWGSQK